MKKLVILACAVAATTAVQAQLALPKVAPTVDQVLSLKRVASPAISPDGRLVAYTVRETNWDDNAYETEIWVADAGGGAPRQLTNAKKSSRAPAWSPNGTRLAFISDRTDKSQLYVINPAAGEAEALTSVDDGINSFEWAPDGKRIAFTASESKSAALKDREKKYGEFKVVEQDYRMSQLFVLDLDTKRTRPLVSGALTVGSFTWSPDGTRIAFDHRVNPSPGFSGTADISIVTVADGSIHKLVTQDGPDAHPVWSPDGTRIAFETAMANPDYFYANGRIAIVAANGGVPNVVSDAFDEDASIVAWRSNGLFFAAAQKTYSYLYRLDPATKAIGRLLPGDASVGSSFDVSADGSKVAFLGSDAQSMADVFVAGVPAPANSSATAGANRPTKLTDMNAQTASWTTSTLEVVSWKSQDGASIEGVLHKPVDFNPSRKYPLLVVIHGGPTGVSRAVPFTSAIYPIDVWVPRGVLVLEPNYRGSAGYGEKFRALNVRNLGVGDAWDVISGVDALIARGLVDPARVGTMGWSQGGYISAFLATHDAARFKAISVGAGISDWTTYYVNTDITPFTRQYLKGTPWADPDIYAKTSPITYIKQAKTPTLIQHGATDQRVPLPNAFELYRGLLDNHVPSKLIVYEGFSGIGHGPTKPKSHRATMDHNLEWFDQYMFAVSTKTSNDQK